MKPKGLSAVSHAIRRLFTRWERRLTLSKREEFVIVTAILTGVLVLTQLASSDLRYPLVALLSVVTYGVSAFALRDDLKGIEWLTLLVPLALYSAAVALFYFLLPVRWLTRIPVAVLYAVGLYAFLLTQNIYNVAAVRTIALLRAARSIGFLLTIGTYFLLVSTALAYRASVVTNTLVVGAINVLLVFPTLWSMELGRTAGERVRIISAVVALVLTEFVWVLSFWPAPPSMIALFLAASFYSMVGMGQEYLANRLYKRTVTEFTLVFGAVFVILLFATRWRGGV